MLSVALAVCCGAAVLVLCCAPVCLVLSDGGVLHGVQRLSPGLVFLAVRQDHEHISPGKRWSPSVARRSFFQFEGGRKGFVYIYAGVS